MARILRIKRSRNWNYTVIFNQEGYRNCFGAHRNRVGFTARCLPVKNFWKG